MTDEQPIGREIDAIELWKKHQVLIAHHEALKTASVALRNAQKAYMANRGNQEYGKQVAVKAKELDEVLGRLPKKEDYEY